MRDKRKRRKETIEDIKLGLAMAAMLVSSIGGMFTWWLVFGY